MHYLYGLAKLIRRNEGQKSWGKQSTCTMDRIKRACDLARINRGEPATGENMLEEMNQPVAELVENVADTWRHL